MYIFYVSQIMASQIKCGSCGLNLITSLGGSGRGGGALYPARLKLKYVCILKSCICVKNVLKLNIRALSIIIVEGLGGLIDILFTRLWPLYLRFNRMHILHTNCIS